MMSYGNWSNSLIHQMQQLFKLTDKLHEPHWLIEIIDDTINNCLSKWIDLVTL